MRNAAACIPGEIDQRSTWGSPWLTERHQAEEERRVIDAQLRQTERLESIGQLAGGIAHDFNNLLSVILMGADLAAGELPAGHPARDQLGAITAAAESSARLTRQLLTFARQDNVRSEPFDLNQVVTEASALLARTLGEQVELVVRTAPELWAVEAERGRLEQVVVNLAVNARDAMPQGGTIMIAPDNVLADADYASMRPSITPGPYVELTVSDTGVGMPREVQERAFEPFFTTKEKGRGTGLGLATVYGVVRQAGGDVRIYSEPGHGTVIRILLPAVEQPATEATRAPLAAPAGRGETVLVVEDEEALREIVVHILRSGGYEVISAARPEDASVLATGREVHLLLTDVVMPGESGPDLAKRLTAERPGLPVLYMSGYTGDAAVQPAFLEGAPMLSKPFTRARLLVEVARVLGRPPVDTPPTGDGPPPSGPGQPAPPSANTAVATTTLGPRVLVADDAPVNRRLAALLLERMGYHVDTVGDGAEVLDALQHTLYDAVVMDCEMPVMDGYTAAAEIRRREGGGPRLPIVAVTGSVTEGDAHRALAAGMDAHVAKPIDARRLGDVIARLVAGHRGRPSGELDTPPAIDRARLDELRELDDDGEGFGGLVRLFLRDIPARLDQLATSARSGDVDAVRVAAHTVKGMAATVGARTLADLADQMELDAQRGHLPDGGALADLAAAADGSLALLADELSGSR